MTSIPSAIIGTAGHIDHGKTALIKALTGIDTDRLKEEKERGISIDLGFAYFEVDGTRTGVVDVPGHERFIRNMLAGAHGMDLVLLVVAADDGVMPQTEEHLDILHLLGIRHGIVVVTKIDLVELSRRLAVREEIAILLADTSLEGAPIFEVSAVTGEGIDALRAGIAAQIRSFSRPAPAGCFRLPVDRAFVMRGHGLVVTGTATAGTITTDDAVRILPGGEEARVRSIQVHGQSVTAAHYGQRIALNLAGIERDDIGRGHVVCDLQLRRVTDRFEARVEIRPAARRPLASHTHVRLHLGTAEVMGKIVWLDGRAAVAPKESGYAQLVLQEPVAAFGGDHFVLRDQTARGTIGGGVILHPFARAPGRARARKSGVAGGGADPRMPMLAALAGAAGPLDRLLALLALEPAFAVSADDLAAAANLRVETVRELLAGQREVRALPSSADAEAYTSEAKWQALRRAVQRALEAFHRQAPRQPGMEMESLRSQLAADLPPKVFRAVVAQLERESVLAREDSLVRLPSHHLGIGPQDTRLAAEVERLLNDAGFTPPDVKEIEARLGIARQPLQDLLAQLEREGRLARVSADLCFAAAAVERARELVGKHVATHGEITAAAFRDLLGASRKFSIALLNYFDRTGFTVRVGDARKLKIVGSRQ